MIFSTNFWNAFEKAYPLHGNSHVGHRLRVLRGDDEQFGTELLRLAARPYETALEELARRAGQKPRRASVQDLEPFWQQVVELSAGWELYQLARAETAGQGALRSSSL